MMYSNFNLKSQLFKIIYNMILEKYDRTEQLIRNIASTEKLRNILTESYMDEGICFLLKRDAAFVLAISEYPNIANCQQNLDTITEGLQAGFFQWLTDKSFLMKGTKYISELPFRIINLDSLVVEQKVNKCIETFKQRQDIIFKFLEALPKSDSDITIYLQNEKVTHTSKFYTIYD